MQHKNYNLSMFIATHKLQPLDAFLNLHLMQFVHYGYAIIKLEEETTDNLGKLSCDALRWHTTEKKQVF